MKKHLLRILSIGAFAVLAGCGGGSNNGTVSSAQSSCVSPNVWSSTYNQCLSQGSCQYGYVTYNNTCVPSTSVGATTTVGGSCPYLSSTQYGCLTQSATCPAGYGLNSANQCVVGTATTGYPGYPGTTYPGQPGYPTTGYPVQPGYPTTGYPVQPGYPTTGYGYQQTCTNTQYGCLYQGGCYPGQVTYNGQCFNLIQPGYSGWNNSYGSRFGFQIRLGF